MSRTPHRPCFRRRSQPLRLWLPALGLLGLLAVQVSSARCLDEDSFDPATVATDPESRQAPAPMEPRQQLQALVREALDRSHAVGASKLLAEAALQDIEEAKAAMGIQANAGLGAGPGGSRSAGVTDTSTLQVRASISVGQLFYDGGRTDRMVDWRQQQAESARLGKLSQEEQIALTTVGLALERGRYRMQSVVYRNYVRKLSCLVEALDTIVRNDRGRASELVQARKSMQQAEMTLSQTQSVLRQIEVRLRRLVGDGLPPVDGLTSLFSGVPDFNQIVSDVDRSVDIAVLDSQAKASRSYAEATSANSKPSLSWTIGGSGSVGAGGTTGPSRSGSYSVGLQLSIPLMNPGLAPAANAARKRAEALLLQRSDALESRRFRAAELFEQTSASLDRARRVGEILRESEQVRNFTLQQWQQLGKRSLFDVMGAEGEHYNLRIAYVNALYDVQQLNANMMSLGRGLLDWLK